MSASKFEAVSLGSPSDGEEHIQDISQRLDQLKCLLEVPNANVDQPKGPLSFYKKK